MNQIKKEHIIQAIEEIDEKGIRLGYTSSFYDLLYNGKKYPPKFVVILANKFATGKELDRKKIRSGPSKPAYNLLGKYGFEIIKKRNNNMNEKLYELKKRFLKEWPIERLKTMTLEEYTNSEKTSFCYWIEAVTTDLGSIWGGSAYKFGIFKRKHLKKTDFDDYRKSDGIYAWHEKYGSNKEEVFENIRNIVLKIASCSKENKLDEIDSIDLGFAYKWKIAFLYSDFGVLNIFKAEWITKIASKFKIEIKKDSLFSDLQTKILAKKDFNEDYFDFTKQLWEFANEEIIDVKADFAEWLDLNSYDSYRHYLGISIKDIIARLDEIDNYFDDFDLFRINVNKIEEFKKALSFKLSKKERLKNPEFVEYDIKNSNGIPKAIIGKNNYFKYLSEKFDPSVQNKVNYWIFQGNPNIYDFQGAVNDGALSSWSVKAHKNKIVEGDKIIFWLTGDKPGCYALGEVTTEIYKAKDDDTDFKYYLDKKENKVTERVGIDISHNLVDAPILKSEMTEIRALKKLKAGNQGTNFLASKEEYEAILDLIHETDISFMDILHRFDSNDLKIYFSFLREILDHFKLQLSDNRLVFSYQNDQLNFTIGQRYCWNLFRGYRQGKFGVISKEKLLPESESFTGNSKEHYYNYYNEISFNSYDKKSIFDAIADQLRKTNKSSFYKYNSADFENYAFDYLHSTPPKKETMTEPINRILFGPPGTGKTFKLKNELFKKYTTKETSITKEKNFENVVKELSWWQVIALALLEIGKSKVGAIFENRWVKQKAQLSESKTIRPTLWGQLQSHTMPECKFVNVKSRQTPYIFNKTKDSFWEILEEEVKEQTPELYEIQKKVDNFVANPDKKIKRYKFTTFHQSFSYEDFIEGIKPIMPEGEEESADLSYSIQPGVFKQLCTDAQNDPDNQYAIFIDEINRGNVSNIFGELITLIETDKRKGAENEMLAILPYSKKKFSVPLNVDIYGTMNTADRSVEALDTALRRRFSFQEIMPNPEIIKLEGKNNGIVEINNGDSINLVDLLSRINERIEVLIDRDHTIGHSYFMEVTSPKQLKLVFKDKIIPLLQEYFYGDYGKIGLVLGKGFVALQKKKENLFADFKYERKDELNNEFYVLKDIDDSFSIVEALEQLMNYENLEEL